MASTGFGIAATFNCTISIEKRMKWDGKTQKGCDSSVYV
jgi:hypothetical protein